MKESNCEFPVTSVRLCLNSLADFSGLICGVTLDRDIEFNGKDAFLYAISEAYNFIGQPQPMFVSKSFSKTPKTYDTYVGNPKRYFTAEEIHKRHGKEATCDLVMTGRKHAEWQGLVKDIDGSLRFRFESVFELISQI